MSPRPAHLVLSSALLLPVLVLAEYRTFTSKDGARKIEAEIQSATTTTVTIQIKDAGVVTSNIDKFSPEDQEFIREWAKENPAPVRWNFSLTPSRTRVGKSNKDTNSHVVEIEDTAYDMVFENRTNSVVEDIELRYRIFIKSEHEEEKNEKGYYISDGTLQVPRMEINARRNLQTKTVPLLTSTIKPGYVHKDGRRGRSSDELAGLWVKVFHKGERVWEFKSANKATNDFTFTDEEAMEIGKNPPKDGKK